jgi:hypothetical protein
MAFPEMFPAEVQETPPRSVVRTLFTDTLDEDASSDLLERLQASTARVAAAQIRVLGGAAARVPAGATAFAHRQRRLMVNVLAAYAEPDEDPVHRTWADDTAMSLRQGEDAAYVNFLADEGAERVRAAYPGWTWQRLAEVKRRYDPENLFRLNQNIPPAARAHHEFG